MRASTRDDAEANGSSIAFVFEYKGKRILFGADSHEDTLLESLGKLTEPGKRYKVNACKLPHHGSRRNVSKALVQALDCDQWWFSSSGARFNHPNDEAIARVVRFGGDEAEARRQLPQRPVEVVHGRLSRRRPRLHPRPTRRRHRRHHASRFALVSRRSRAMRIVDARASASERD